MKGSLTHLLVICHSDDGKSDGDDDIGISYHGHNVDDGKSDDGQIISTQLTFIQ